MRLGIFGGTFNPVHLGHLRTAEEVGYKLDLDKVIFIPSGNPPLKALDLPDAQHRYEMTKLATESNVNFTVSDIELRQAGKSYTVNTLQRLHGIYPQDELLFILGTDAFLDIPHWWQPDRLISMADFVIVARPEFSPEDLAKSPYVEHESRRSHPFIKPVPCSDGRSGNAAAPEGSGAVSATCDCSTVRFRLRGGRSAVFVRVTPLDISSTDIRMLVRENKSIRYLLPETVEKYIHAHSLYR